ncbi:hypothetical protein CHM34_11435 [Paludifilum halophilum]|uniref:SHOCT domain-containing protein n=2 Tax=Paludifilum halophilum TaxID=1642702 RepID=A0A235B6F8_9BACL|nr:hypothetical protein CHM34_11435 [Paludifilum halophilum]
MMDGYMYPGGMILMMILWVLLIGFAVYGLFMWISRDFGKKEARGIRILEERFARGEIDEEEFKQKREVLKKK